MTEPIDKSTKSWRAFFTDDAVIVYEHIAMIRYGDQYKEHLDVYFVHGPHYEFSDNDEAKRFIQAFSAYLERAGMR